MSWALLRPMPPIEDLYDYYDYNPDTGIITRRGKHRPLGYIHRPTGYRLINYSRNGVKIHFYAQRLAYTFYTGTDPYPLLIDHINRDKDDNRIINLRTATHKENSANTTPPTIRRQRKPKPPELLAARTEKGYYYSGENALCVYQRKKDGRWFVLIDNTYYGTRATQEEAIILRDEVIASKRKV